MTAETKIDTGTDELLCVIRERVAIITLNRPEARNSLSDNLTPALRNMIKACGENPDVGVLLLTGAGTAFCAGGNVKGMGANRDKKKLEMSHDERVADLQERQRLLTGALVSVRKPTIAALPGPAVGAGLALAMACDIRISQGRPERRLRHCLAADAAGRHVAGAGIDVHLRQGRCRQMRGDRPGEPRGP
jgi:enoyl-CoA hydratase/carnithine racemase